MDIKAKSHSASTVAPQPSSTATSAADQQLKNVSALYEKQFLREMVKQMRSTVNESALQPASFAEKYYREQLDHQYVESWGDQGGIGLGKMIYDQLLSRYGEQLGIKAPATPSVGPIPLGQRDQWNGAIEKESKVIQFRRKPTEGPVSPTPLENPWEGEWLGSFTLENGLRAIKIQHAAEKGTENKAFTSLIVGDFQPSSYREGDRVKAGERLGLLNPAASSFQWRWQEYKD